MLGLRYWSRTFRTLIELTTIVWTESNIGWSVNIYQLLTDCPSKFTFQYLVYNWTLKPFSFTVNTSIIYIMFQNNILGKKGVSLCGVSCVFCFWVLRQVIYRCRYVETSSGDLSQLHAQSPTTIDCLNLVSMTTFPKYFQSSHAYSSPCMYNRASVNLPASLSLLVPYTVIFCLTGYGREAENGRQALVHAIQQTSLLLQPAHLLQWGPKSSFGNRKLSF